MTKLVKHLWAGEVPLRRAVWQYAAGYGLLLNIITTLVFLALIARDADTALIVLAFALPVS